MQKLRTCEHNSTYTTLSLYLDVLDGWTLLPHATSSISIVSYNIHGSFTITIPSGVCCCALCCSCQISFIKIFEVYWLVGCIYIDELTDFGMFWKLIGMFLKKTLLKIFWKERNILNRKNHCLNSRRTVFYVFVITFPKIIHHYLVIRRLEYACSGSRNNNFPWSCFLWLPDSR